MPHVGQGLGANQTINRTRGLSPLGSAHNCAWLKTKCFTESACLIIGTARDRKTRALLASLARAYPQGLSYAGTAFITLSGDQRDDLRAHLKSVKLNGARSPACDSLMLNG